MNIILNGKDYTINDNSTINDLVCDLGYDKSKIAVELNLDIIPKSMYEKTYIVENDKLEIVTFVGGG